MQGNHIVAKNTPVTKKLDNRASEPELGIDSWQMLQIFSIYRFLLASAFFILIALDAGTVGKQQPLFYIYVLLIYFLLSIVYAVNAFFRNQAYYSQVLLQILTDITALSFILYTSGGLSSGLNILFLPVIAAASVLTPGKNSFFYAAIATIAVLSEQAYSFVHDAYADKSGFTLAGLTGIAIFATAIAVNYIHRRLTASQQLGKEYKATIEKFEQIITTVLHKMPLGVIVVNETNAISIVNHSAQKLLALNNSETLQTTTNVDLPIHVLNALQQWRLHSSSTQKPAFTIDINTHKISAQFTPLSDDHHGSVLIMIDDLRTQEQQAQNMKLISLGRLTASIAHEIRNPLNAINHAAQLLSEIKNLRQEDEHLLSIIQSNSARTNKIIESVLLLSKSKPTAQQKLNLNTWIDKFIKQFIAHGHQQNHLEFKCNDKEAAVYFDPIHLQQILTNLCENGIRYSLQATNKPYVLLQLHSTADEVYLDIIDHGPGITNQNLKFLFEPFFTTENSGTGLGLFVANELCLANGATLEYINNQQQGGCFRIHFPNNP